MSKNCDPNKYCVTEINPIALRKTKTVYNLAFLSATGLKD